MIKKKILVFALAGVLAVTAINSKAFIALGAPVVAMLGSNVVTQLGTALLGASVAALIGQQMGWLDIPSKDAAGNPVNVRLPLTPLTRDRLVANPDLPSTIAPTTQPYPTSQQALNSCFEFMSGSCPSGQSRNSWYDSVGSGSVRNYACHWTCSLNSSVVTSGDSDFFYSNDGSVKTTCVDGYTLEGSSCVITNRNIIPDGKADIEVFSPAAGVVAYRRVAGDPDSDAGLTISQGAALFSMLHPDRVDGYPAGYWDNRDDAPAIHVAVDPSGGTSDMCPYQTCIPIPGLPGHFRISALSNTATGSQAVVIDVNSSSGVVTQANVVPLSGQILSQGQTYTNTAGQVSTVQAGQVVVANPSGSSYVQAANLTQAINTSDLAKTGEAAAAASTVVNALNTNLQDVPLDSAPTTNAITSALNSINDNLTPKPENQPDINFSWLPSFLPGSYTACSPFTFSMNPTIGAASGFVGNGEIDICDKLDLARQILGWLLGVVTVFYIFRVFVQSNKAAL